MDMKKHIVLFSLVLILLIPACSKKKKQEEKKEKGYFALSESSKVASSQIPVVKEEVVDFFDEGNISEFAFVDDDFSENEEELKDLFEAEKESSDIEKVASLDEDKGFVTKELIDEDEVGVTWKEEDENEGDELTFKTVQFDINENKIRKDQKAVLKENIERAKSAAEEGKKIVVQGHCCQLGSPGYNIPLSERRANAIKKEMVKNGIPENSIKTIGCGQEMPVVWSDNPNKEEKVKELSANRRSEILIG
jgi:outer membrane protein OmpA-like peptidoglycan-associated protein